MLTNENETKKNGSCTIFYVKLVVTVLHLLNVSKPFITMENSKQGRTLISADKGSLRRLLKTWCVSGGVLGRECLTGKNRTEMVQSSSAGRKKADGVQNRVRRDDVRYIKTQWSRKSRGLAHSGVVVVITHPWGGGVTPERAERHHLTSAEMISKALMARTDGGRWSLWTSGVPHVAWWNMHFHRTFQQMEALRNIPSTRLWQTESPGIGPQFSPRWCHMTGLARMDGGDLTA